MSNALTPSTPPSRSLNRQVVLEEDEYMTALSAIIARDFFPSLSHLDATNGYLDALRSQDPHLIDASVRRLEEVGVTPARPFPLQTPGRTPYGGGPSETPLPTPRGEAPAKRARYDTDLSLDAFQARYTSEDNSSFTEILDEENRKRKERWGWAWEAQRRVEAQKERLLEERERLLIEPQSMVGVREKFRIEKPQSKGLIEDGKGKEKEGDEEEKDGEKKGDGEETDGDEKALAVVQSSSTVDVMASRKDTRSAAVDGWKFKARNSLMFPPDADESPYHTKPSEFTGDPRAIVHGSTRLPEQDDRAPSRAMSAPPSPTRSHINAAIMGTPYRPRSSTINNFSLVPNLPSPTPDELGPKAVKQLMTWGTLNATPRVISQSQADADLPPPRTPFHIPAPSARETISHKLSNNASKSLRVKAGLLGLGGRTPGIATPGKSTGKKGAMAPPNWTPRRSEAAGSLTPAARRLLDRSTMGTMAARRAEAMERVARWDVPKQKETDLNRVRWTPTPTAK
ncbi:nuclear protein DGCR14 [Mycena maculata]|uniref:Nuclear protein DGCR14 n=1 Tax=Mycena maculata TaxID=230809 RepID=A0AAD7KEE5_9AGAR|nr:nuclear protein DGCR14 [Mycena maculata]